jgi:hypothetical protein
MYYFDHRKKALVAAGHVVNVMEMMAHRGKNVVLLNTTAIFFVL